MHESMTIGIPLTNKREAEKWNKGKYEVYVETKSVEVVRWKDNSIVTMASNCISSRTCLQVSRWNAAERKIVKIDCPQSVHDYNKNMDGCDLHDQFQYTYEFAIRMKK